MDAGVPELGCWSQNWEPFFASSQIHIFDDSYRSGLMQGGRDAAHAAI